ncbi:MAG: hypothetical protein ACLTC8_02100 [Lachnospiraceae bacterium]
MEDLLCPVVVTKSHITVCGQIIQLRFCRLVFLGVCQKIRRIIQHINVAGFLIGSGKTADAQTGMECWRRVSDKIQMP